MADFEQIGEFDTQEEVNDWARRNNVDPRDISQLNGRKIQVSVRVNTRRMSDAELRDSRNKGFFS